MHDETQHTCPVGSEVTLTCSQLGGPAACHHELKACNFEEMGGKSQAHVGEMLAGGDAEHKASVDEMMALSPEDQQKEFAGYKQVFDTAAAA